MSQHHAKFTWGTGPQSVSVAGGFNDWSGNATPLSRQADGSFLGDVAMPWGEKQAFKYVVDGEWKVREDEAKEWDAAGNMNNVYTAPHAPATKEDAPAPAPVNAFNTTDSHPSTATNSIPPTSTNDVVPTTTTHHESSSAPVAAAIPFLGLGAVAGGNDHFTSAKTERRIFDDTPTQEYSQNPLASEPARVQALGTTSVASNATLSPASTNHATPASVTHTNAGHATTTNTTGTSSTNTESAQEEAHGLAATAQGYASGVLGSLGAALGGVAQVVERATGIDLIHGDPLTVQEAKAKGLDVDHAKAVDGRTDTISPAGTKPPAAAVADLEEKVQQLKLENPPKPDHSSGDAYSNAPAPLRTENPDERPHDIPAQDETEDEHKFIPAPVISAISARDPAKDRTVTSTNGETAGTKPIDDNPGVSAAAAKHEAESHPGTTGSKTAAITGGLDSATGPGETFADPTAKSTNTGASTGKSSSLGESTARSTPATENKAEAISNAAAKTPIGVAGPTTAAPVAPAPIPAPAQVSEPVPAKISTPAKTQTLSSTQTPSVSAPAQSVVTSTPTPALVAPATPVKSSASATAKPSTVGVGATTSTATPVKQIINTNTSGVGAVGSPSSTVASSPAPVHQRETTGGSDVRKRKSSFFNKIKHAFSPKDKEKK